MTKRTYKCPDHGKFKSAAEGESPDCPDCGRLCPDPDRLMTAKDVAHYIGVSEQTVYTWKREERGPEVVHLVGRSIRYRKSDVDAWLMRRR